MPLSSWKRLFTVWLTRKSGVVPLREASTPVIPVRPARAKAADPGTLPEPGLTPDDLRAPFLRWLLNQPAASESTASPGPGKAQPIALLDATLASDAALANLLPRAAQIVPQLIKSLRDERYSATEVAQRISRDVVLKTEVLRLANSLHYGGGRAPVVDLVHAVSALGSDGLQRAIAKVVLRPIYESRSAPLSVFAAPRIWQASEDKARLCVALAPGFAVAPLDAYLAGLLHDIGWSAAFRILDAARPAQRAEALTGGGQLAASLFRRRDMLFGKLVRPWQISDALVALAGEASEPGLDASTSMAAQMLRIADHLAIHHQLQRAALLPPGLPAVLSTLPPLVAQTYLGLATEPDAPQQVL